MTRRAVWIAAHLAPCRTMILIEAASVEIEFGVKSLLNLRKKDAEFAAVLIKRNRCARKHPALRMILFF